MAPVLLYIIVMKKNITIFIILLLGSELAFAKAVSCGDVLGSSPSASTVSSLQTSATLKPINPALELPGLSVFTAKNKNLELLAEINNEAPMTSKEAKRLAISSVSNASTIEKMKSLFVRIFNSDNTNDDIVTGVRGSEKKRRFKNMISGALALEYTSEHNSLIFKDNYNEYHPGIVGYAVPVPFIDMVRKSLKDGSVDLNYGNQNIKQYMLDIVNFYHEENYKSIERFLKDNDVVRTLNLNNDVENLFNLKVALTDSHSKKALVDSVVGILENLEYSPRGFLAENNRLLQRLVEIKEETKVKLNINGIEYYVLAPYATEGKKLLDVKPENELVWNELAWATQLGLNLSTIRNEDSKKDLRRFLVFNGGQENTEQDLTDISLKRRTIVIKDGKLLAGRFRGFYSPNTSRSRMVGYSHLSDFNKRGGKYQEGNFDLNITYIFLELQNTDGSRFVTPIQITEGMSIHRIPEAVRMDYQ